MIIKTIQTTTGRKKLTIPTSLAEITLGQMIELEKDGNPGIIVEGLTDELFDNIVAIQDRNDIEQRILSLAHQIGYCYQELKIPDRVKFGKDWFDVPKNLSIEPAGAYLVSRNIIADEMNKCEDLEHFRPSLNACAKLLANYFYCRVTGDVWGEQQAESFVSEVLKLPVTVALPIARYFFLNYPNLLNQNRSLWQAVKQIWNEKRVLRNLKNSNTLTL